MKKIRFSLLKLIALLLLLVASDAYAYRPIEGKITINGVEFSYLYGAYTTPRIILEPGQLSAFLTGVACASPAEIAGVKVEFSQWFDNPSFTAVLMYVDYKDGDRDGEYYVATYKKTGGVIDAALLSSTFDVRRVAWSRYLFPQMGYYHLTDNIADITMEERSVTVQRVLKTTYGINK